MDSNEPATLSNDPSRGTSAASMEIDRNSCPLWTAPAPLAAREGVHTIDVPLASTSWGHLHGERSDSGILGPTLRTSASDKETMLSSSSSQRGRASYFGRFGTPENDTGLSPSFRARAGGTSKDRPKLSNPLRRAQLCSKLLMGVLCLLALVPFAYRVPVAGHGLLFQTGERPSLLPVGEGLKESLLGSREEDQGVIDSEKVLAAVIDSDEKARTGAVQQVQNAKVEPEGGAARTSNGGGRSADNVTLTESASLWSGIFAGGGQEEFECDRSSPLTDVCTIRGDVRINVTSGEVVLYARNQQTLRGQRHIRPHPRKWNWGLMESSVTQFTIQSVDYNDPGAPVMECTKRNTAPGVVFSVGGFCGGVFHDFNEVYLPLFETTHAYKGDVVMLVADLKGDWWWHDAPRRSFVGAMTRHAIRLIGRGIDTESYAQGVECFDHVKLGLYQNLCMYDEFGGRESRAFARSRVTDFAPYVRKGLQVPDPGESRVFVPAGAIPVVGIVQRMGTRKLVNYQELLQVAEREGFKVVPITFEHLSPEQAAETMAPLDVLIGVHGAGLSNICLMRPGGVVMQIMPYGEGGPRNVIGLEYKNFAAAMEADYLEWSVPVYDSTIKDQYNHTDWIVTSPLMIWKHRGQDAMNIYHSQDVVMPEDMFGAYLRQIRRTLHLKARLAQELGLKPKS